MKSSVNLGIYNKTYGEVEKGIVAGLVDFYQNPSSVYMKPFRIFGNLYYVGDTRVCAHLIDTGDGLILFDAGYQHTIHLLVQAIWEAGFNPKDIKYLILSHGHFDHFGAANEFRNLYHCKTFMGRADCDMMRQSPGATLLYMNPDPYAQLPVIDCELEDGDVITLGNTSIKCVHSPGHSPGTMSFFFDVTDGTKTYKASYFGGIGFLTLYKDYLKEYHLPLSLRDDFSKTIEKLKGMEVDIVLGNHPSHNATVPKRQKMLENPDVNPFIDPLEWDRNLVKIGAEYRAFLEKDA